MCGIAGELNFDGQQADTVAVRRMTHQLARRGPDGAGLVHYGPRAFGHRRLRIMDLSDRAQQPMVDSELGLGIVYNGAIYNHHELREELEQLGYRFFSTGDTEVVLKAWHAWGRDAVQRFHGMFAFALWERDSGRTHLVRDRLGIKPLYLAEQGARVTLFTDTGPLRGTILPLKASGHTYNDEVDTQPVTWSQVELRVDARAQTHADLESLGINIGDYIAVDPQPDIDDNGFINSRHLDDKAGVAVVLGVAKALVESGKELPIDCHLLFTISEEVGSGASHVLHGDVAEMVTIDTAPNAPGQNTSEFGVTIAVQDSDGPFDYHLTHKLLRLCRDNGIEHRRDVFRYYHSDSASAIDAGNDIRTALACFGADATHGWERTHRESLTALAELLLAYARSGPTLKRDRNELSSLDGFSTLPID